jgi:CubicO group peptidase (beta-lactamase class C family)
MTTKEAPHRDYGFAWEIKPYGFAHGGAEQTYMGVDPEEGLAGVLMTQVAGPPCRADTPKLSSAFAAAAFGDASGGHAGSTGKTEGQ